MTTFQDPPPQSRRAVRQSERGENPSQVPASSLPYSFDPGSQAVESVDQAASAQAAPTENVPQISGRRAQLPQAALVQQHLTFAPSATNAGEATEAERVAPPTSDVYTREHLANQAPPTSEQPVYRVRDFSPEGRRAAITREQFAGVSQGLPAAAAPPPTTAPVDLDYFTVGVPAGHSHVATPPETVDQPSDHTLTRRELRELRAAQEEPPALRLPDPIDTLLNSGPIDIPVLSAVPGQSQALADAMAEFDALTRGRREAEARAAQAPVAQATTAEAPVIAAPVWEEQAVSAEPEPASGPAAAVVPPFSVPVISASIPLPVTSTPWPAPAADRAMPVEEASPVPVEEASPQAAGAVDPVFIEPERTPSTRPVGHWSIQSEIDDDEQPAANRISHTVGSGSVAVTTSALVLPSVPQSTDFTSPFSSTGEILVTGSIDLPRSLSSTGAHPHRVDNSDFEDDPLDSEVPSTDSAPVRAIRAVSTHTSTRGVIESKRPQSNRMPTIMIISASVLAVGVVGLLVAAAVMHLFG
jgi:hypothetical protein